MREKWFPAVWKVRVSSSEYIGWMISTFILPATATCFSHFSDSEESIRVNIDDIIERIPKIYSGKFFSSEILKKLPESHWFRTSSILSSKDSQRKFILVMWKNFKGELKEIWMPIDTRLLSAQWKEDQRQGPFCLSTERHLRAVLSSLFLSFFEWKSSVRVGSVCLVLLRVWRAVWILPTFFSKCSWSLRWFLGNHLF